MIIFGHDLKDFPFHTDLSESFIILTIAIVILLGIVPIRVVMLGIIIVFAYYALYKKETFNQSKMDDLNTEVDQLNSIMNDIREYQSYNPKNYHTLKSLMAKFVRYGNDLQYDHKHPGHTFEAVLELKEKILNSFHSFIYTVPHHPATNDKYHIVMNRLRKTLDEWVDISYKKMSRQYTTRDVNVHTLFNYYKFPKPMDSMRDEHYQYF